MNVQEYISSGIVESFVLGLASAEEQAEFESMCRQYPEVLRARNEFELVLEQQAMQNAVTPPAGMKQRVMDAALYRDEAKVIAMPSATKTNWLKYAAAACAILLAGSLFWNISQYNRNKKLQASYDEVVKDYDSTAIRLGELEDEIAMISLNPNVKMAAMKGMEASPASFATVYWDTTSKDVYLVVNNLPKPASDKQYQLWALLDGKPIDVGMIDNDSFIGERKLLLRMKNVAGAQAFAITLEKKGGNPTPQGSMYVMGNL
ncbi:anti-sigma factor [Terrimonas pollutisoli]|uniref:anti-sigma factor n=1 Tax=Terrimonas pollutisoli TaxID=3034147 RepID=UPI0023EB4CCC|nr:anti-sigma factor [Terrimonas sp. H1YJ31]